MSKAMLALLKTPCVSSDKPESLGKKPKQKPTKRTIDKVGKYILDNPNCDRKSILLGSGVSNYCLDNCIGYMVDKSIIEYTEDGMRGAHMRKLYSVITC